MHSGSSDIAIFIRGNLNITADISCYVWAHMITRNCG